VEWIGLRPGCGYWMCVGGFGVGCGGEGSGASGGVAEEVGGGCEWRGASGDWAEGVGGGCEWELGGEVRVWTWRRWIGKME
jgi:hypothetical protein